MIMVKGRFRTLVKMKNFIGISLILLLLNCVHYAKYIPDPEKDIEKWVENFPLQRSFSYQYQFQTKSVFAEAKGTCVVDRSEHIRGVWHYSDSRLEFEHIGLGDIEYTRKDGKWQESSRGEESDILIQIKRLLSFNKFEYLGGEDDFLYRFKANAPFLAPKHWKEMIGIMKISRKNYLPKVVWAGLPDSSVYWEVKLCDYNKKKRIKSPVRNWVNYVISDATDTKCFNAIKKRLKSSNLDFQIKKKNGRFILSLPKQHKIEDVKVMLSPGQLRLYRLTEHKSDAKRIVYLLDDFNKPLYVTEEIVVQDRIKNAKIKFDSMSRPFVLISLNKKIDLSPKIALEIDSLVVGTATLDTVKKIDKISLYSDMRYYSMEILRARLIQSLPAIDIKELPAEFN
jgi:hypothetical protein